MGQFTEGHSIALDGSDNAYVTGRTTSTNLHTTTGAFQTTRNGAVDAFITKLNSTGSNLIYSTYIGGSDGYTKGNSIVVDAQGDAYITGQTISSNFPTTNGAFQTTLGSPYGNVFVTKLNLSSETLVESNNSSVPNKFELMQNYPNPFNPTTTIDYLLQKPGLVTIKIYDILGREIKTLVNEEKTAGSYSVQFSARGGSAFGGNGSEFSSGIYFYRMQLGDFSQTKKLILLK